MNSEAINQRIQALESELIELKTKQVCKILNNKEVEL